MSGDLTDIKPEAPPGFGWVEPTLLALLLLAVVVLLAVAWYRGRRR